MEIPSIIRPLFDRASKYARTDMLYVFRGGFWTSISFGSGSLLSLVLVIAFANLLPKETYGFYRYILSLSGTIGFLTLSGMNTALGRAIARGEEGLLRYAIRVQLKFNTLFTVGSLGIATYYFIKDHPAIAWSLIILGITFPIAAAFNSYGVYLSGKQRFREASIYGSYTSIIHVAAMLVTLWLTRNPVILIASYGVSQAVPNIWFYWRISREVPRRTNQEQRRELFTYGGHLSFLNILVTINQYLDKILVFHHFGAVQLASYALASAVPGRIKGYTKSIIGISFPKLAQKNLADLQKSLALRTLQGMCAGTVIVISYWFLAPHLFALLFPQYLDSIEYSKWIMTTFIFTIPGGYLAYILHAQGLIQRVYISSLTTSLTRLILFLILAPIYGVAGIIAVLIASSAIGMAVNIVLVRRPN